MDRFCEKERLSVYDRSFTLWYGDQHSGGVIGSIGSTYSQDSSRLRVGMQTIDWVCSYSSGFDLDRLISGSVLKAILARDVWSMSISSYSILQAMFDQVMFERQEPWDLLSEGLWTRLSNLDPRLLVMRDSEWAGLWVVLWLQLEQIMKREPPELQFQQSQQHSQMSWLQREQKSQSPRVPPSSDSCSQLIFFMVGRFCLSLKRVLALFFLKVCPSRCRYLFCQQQHGHKLQSLQFSQLQLSSSITQRQLQQYVYKVLLLVGESFLRRGATLNLRILPKRDTRGWTSFMYSDPSHSQHRGAEPCIWRLLWSPKQWKHLYLGQGLTKLLMSQSMLTPSDGFLLWSAGRKEGVSGWGEAMGLCPSPIIAQKQLRVSSIWLVYWEKFIIFIVCPEATIAHYELISFEGISVGRSFGKGYLLGRDKGISYQSTWVFPEAVWLQSKSQMFSQQDFPKEERFDLLANDPQLNIDCFNHCLTSFYDHDSEPIVHSNCSVQQVICYLEHLHDIRDTPLSDLMLSVTSNPAFQGVELQVVRRKLLKLKNRLKRERAKNRNKQGIHDIRTPAFRVPLESEEEQLKKRNNRLSAQLSRDRKKEKVRALEQLNRELQEECNLQKMENQRLKKQAQKSQQSQLASPFTRMILFLGIFFLFTVVKDVLSTAESSKAITKMQEKTFTLAAHDRTSPLTFISQKEALQTIEEGLVEGIGESEIAYKVLQGVRAKLGEWWGPQPMGMILGGTALSSRVAVD